jgi:TonB family protein
MRYALAMLGIFLFSSFVVGQTPSSETARQALLEMFFGESAGHFEKHLPDLARRSFSKLSSPDGQNFLAEFSLIASQMRSSSSEFHTFDTGPTLLSIEDPHNAGGIDKLELTVERDDLIGEEDQIELGLHMSRNGNEETLPTLPVIPRFTFSMKQEAGVWRLNEISISVRLPLADPDFLKAMEERQRSQNEGLTIGSIQQLNMAEKTYSAIEGHFACSLSALAPKGPSGSNPTYLYDPQLATGNKNGYLFVISACDSTHYKVVAEPAVSGSGQRAFCSDESGIVRASSDGKGTTCLESVETVQAALPNRAIAISAVAAGGTGAREAAGEHGGQTSPAPPADAVVPFQPANQDSARPTRIRVSAAVMQARIVRQVQPVYPQVDKITAQGPVVLNAVIGKDGSVQSAKVVSGVSPLLNQAALDAVTQWKYQPYLVHGQPLEVDTTISVNFTPAGK